MQEELVTEALRKALATRPVAQGMIVHSDRGGSTRARPSENCSTGTRCARA